MAFIKNLDPNGERILPDLGLVIASGDYEEVPEEVAVSLAEQAVWELVDARGKTIKGKPKPAPAEQLVESVEAAGPDSLLGPEVAAVEAPQDKKSTKNIKAGEAN